MLSITETKRRLPKDFINHLYETFSPLVVDSILIGMMTKRYTTVRVNTLKCDIQTVMNELKSKNIKFERVNWYTDALILKKVGERELQKLEFYEKGYFYLQSLSSMIPPLVLDPKPGEFVLDVTAAPGSKTTQMAALMKNKGEIVANELDQIRWERLKYNIEKQGAKIVKSIKARGEKLGKQYPNQFDKVLLDSPCSGEGKFSMSCVQTYRNWSPKMVSQLAKLQKKLFESAYQALKPNGIMVYSTCTLNQTENEEILDWAFKNFSFEILPIDLKIKHIVIGMKEKKDVSIQKSIRILPSKEMEGFFVCKLRKK